MEEWRKIEGHEGYEVSNIGNIRSFKHGKIRIRKLVLDSKGYYQVNLSINGKCKLQLVHRLLAIAFIPNPDNKPCIDHINRIRTDNRIENLRWATMEENMSNQNLSIRNKLGVQYISCSRKRFRFQIRRNGISHSKYFKTLEEAEAYRNQYLMM